VLKLNVDFPTRPESTAVRAENSAKASSHARPAAAPETGNQHNGNASL